MNMRKILLLISIMMTLGWLSSCEIETSSKGNLYGFWHLVSIDSLSNETPQGIVCRFEREGDSLFFDTPYYLDRAKGDSLVVDVERMNYYGLNAMKPRMLIESLSSNKMVIKTAVARLKFRKM